MRGPSSEVPPGPRDLLARAWHLFDSQRAELAARECRSVLGLEPDSFEAHGLLALCLVRLARPEEAETSARESIRCDPAGAWSHFVLGLVLRRLGRYREADVALREAIRIDPERVEYSEQLGWTLIDAGLNRVALGVARRARRLNPVSANVAAIEGLACEALGSVDEAEAAFRDALRLDPENDAAHAGMGYLALRRRVGPEAAKAFQSALAISPGYGWAERGLAQALRMRVPGYARMDAVEAWIKRRTSMQRGLLLVGGTLGLGALLVLPVVLVTPGKQRTSVLSFVAIALLLLLPYAWAFAFWALRPIGELFLWMHPVGKWLVRRDRLRHGWLLCGMLVIGGVLLVVGALVRWQYGFTAGLSCVLAVPGTAAQFRETRPGWGAERLYLGIAVLLGLVPGGPGELSVSMFGYILLWFQVYYFAYLTIPKP